MYTKCQCSSKKTEYKYSDQELTLLEERLKLVGVKTRLIILFLLEGDPHCVCDLTAHTGLSQSLISHHLADLEEACFISSKKEGKFVEYFLTQTGKEFVHTLFHILMCCSENSAKGGENELKQDKHDCDCEDEKKKCCDGESGECCKEESKTKDMSKEDLQSLKESLEKKLEEVNQALTDKE
jgi:DNA-binding transcriptional ArsR family regulator